MPFTKRDATKIYRKLEAILDEAEEKGDCDHLCRKCALLSKIRTGKGTQCTLNILQLCLTGALE